MTGTACCLQSADPRCISALELYIMGRSVHLLVGLAVSIQFDSAFCVTLVHSFLATLPVIRAA